MPTVTSANRVEIIKSEMAKKEMPKKKEHISANLPGLENSKVIEKHKETTYPHANQAWNEMTRGVHFKQKGWKTHPDIFYGEDLEPVKDAKWKHAVRPLEHPEHGMKHMVLSQEPRGYTIRHYEE
jgi:hypothetical protein